MKTKPKNYRDLDEFTKAYIECAFWTLPEDDLMENKTIYDIAPESLEKIITDCANFQAIASQWNATDAQAGHDFWLTRNGHGAGFWDGDWPEHGDALTEWSKTFGPCDLYIGDDG